MVVAAAEMFNVVLDVHGGKGNFSLLDQQENQKQDLCADDLEGMGLRVRVRADARSFGRRCLLVSG
jgi:hypothetical protein